MGAFLSFEHKICLLFPLLPHICDGGESRLASRDANPCGLRVGRMKSQLPASSLRWMLSWVQGVPLHGGVGTSADDSSLCIGMEMAGEWELNSLYGNNGNIS